MRLLCRGLGGLGLVIAALAVLGVAMSPASAEAIREPGPGQADAEPAEPRPSPEWRVEQVLRWQLEALQRAGQDDPERAEAAMRTVWSFASPTNQEQTGPFERFDQMVRAMPYGLLVGHAEHTVLELNAIEQDGPAAMFAVVRITTKDGQPFLFQWVLSLQQDEPYVDCWMSDSVMPVGPPPEDPRRPV